MDKLTPRQEGMVTTAPQYYHYSKIYAAIQGAQADEYDTIEEKNADLKKQMYIPTATWGLMYWELLLDIPTVANDPYHIRRSRVLSRWRGFGNFSAALIRNVCEAYTNGEVSVDVDVLAGEVKITFVGVRGIPENLKDLQELIADVIHAHLGPSYHFTYLVWNGLDAAALTWDELDALNLTWDELETWKPGT